MKKNTHSEEHNPMESGIYSKGSVSLVDLLHAVRNNPFLSNAGDIISFTGIVRNSSKNGKAVREMRVEVDDNVVNTQIKNLCEMIKKRDGIVDVRIVHFKGEMYISDNLLLVVIASAHRKEGLVALEETLEKCNAIMKPWKKEILR